MTGLRWRVMPKHFQISVPNYPRTGSGGSPLSYLRLGAAFGPGASLTEAQRGDDHVKGATFKADATWRFSAPAVPPATGVSSGDYGVDLYKDEGKATTVTTGAAATLSGELLERGGSREHTDGNRISTTRGDCVEVVGGNYKLIVLGRVNGDSPAAHVGPSTWESSGGHNHQSTSTPGEVTLIRWTTTDGGTWEVTEVTEKGEVHSAATGRFEEVFSGPRKESYTGWGGPAGVAGTSTSAAKKPDITETTYARQVTSILECPTVTETVTADSITEHTEVKAAFGQKHDFLDVEAGGSVESNKGTAAHPITTFKETLNTGFIFSFESFATKETKSSGNWTNNIEIGASAEVSIGTVANLHWDRIALGVNIGASYETSWSLSGEVLVGLDWAFKIGMGQKVSVDSKSLKLVDMLIGYIYQKKIGVAESDLAFAEMCQMVNAVLS